MMQNDDTRQTEAEMPLWSIHAQIAFATLQAASVTHRFPAPANSNRPQSHILDQIAAYRLMKKGQAAAKSGQ